MSHRKTIYGSLHCLAAVIDGKHVQDAIAHPCYVSGKKTFSVIFYYFDGHANYVRFSFTNKSIRRCVRFPHGEVIYGWHVEDATSANSNLNNLYLVLADNDGFIVKNLLRTLSPKYESYHEDVKYLQKTLMPLGCDISCLKECPIRLVTEIRFYLMFMREHKYPNRKEFRKLLKSRQTFKTISVNSSFSKFNGDETTLTCFLFMYFWLQHQCQNPDCNKFSYMKCGECKQAYYCSKTCQEKHWKYHQQDCEDDKSYGQIENYIMREFQRLLETNVKPDVVGIKSALKRIKFKIFQLNAMNNMAITCMKTSPTSIESSFTEKTYLKLLDKPPKEERIR